MRGSDERQSAMFSFVSMEDRIPADHPLRRILVLTDRALESIRPLLDGMYADHGRPSIAPERLLRAMVLQLLYSVRSERLLMEQISYNLLFRWFVGLGMDEAVWVATTFSKNRERLLARHVADKRLLRIVRRFLEAGMMTEGTCVRRSEGTPQGGPLSPLLANLLLDDLDQELERRGHRFCRYADDCNIYVQSQVAGERVLASVTAFLERKLKLQVNREKSAVAPAWERKFLGYRLLSGGRLGLAPSSADRAKDRLRHLTRRNRGRGLEEIVGEINRFTVGWLGYFRYAECRSWLRDVDGWLRQKLRCYRLKQAKRTKAIADLLRSLGVPEQSAWATAACSRGWWRTSHTPGIQASMDQAWFDPK